MRPVSSNRERIGAKQYVSATKRPRCARPKKMLTQCSNHPIQEIETGESRVDPGTPVVGTASITMVICRFIVLSIKPGYL
jgi:hypothetical protein